MDYVPNVDAAIWFAAEVLPLVRAQRPSARFLIVGSNPSEAVRRLGKLDGITVTGRVADVRPYLFHAVAAVCPMRIARGDPEQGIGGDGHGQTCHRHLQGPLEGIDAVPGRDLGLADETQTFATAALRLAGNRQCSDARRRHFRGPRVRPGRAAPGPGTLRLGRLPQRVRRADATGRRRRATGSHTDGRPPDRGRTMSQPAAAMQTAPPAGTMTFLRQAWLGLAIGVVALGLLFHAEIAAAVNTWIDSTAYNHCFLVIPIAGYLIWDRRASLGGLPPRRRGPSQRVLVLPLAAIWLAAERLGIMEGRQLIAMTIVEVLFLAVLGLRLWRATSGPLLYLYFLVPFGDFLTPKLQDITTWFTRHGLDILGIPAYIDGYVIEIPEGTFFVAEACAGLRFLIASIAFGVLYALLMYRSTGRRMVFIGASVVVPIVANGLRALGIVVLGHVLGSAQAAATDHVLYGWIFFSLVILLLIVLGLPFRQDNELGAANRAPHGGQSRRVTARAACGFDGGRGGGSRTGSRTGPEPGIGDAAGGVAAARSDAVLCQSGTRAVDPGLGLGRSGDHATGEL